MAAIRTGLTCGTAVDQYFMEGYGQARAADFEGERRKKRR